MKIIEVKSLLLPEIKVISFGRFPDQRGYFSEIYKKSDFENLENGRIFGGLSFLQINEAYSKTGTVRGLHFQWDPVVGKLIRTIKGRMVDMIMDIRIGSPNLGKIILHDLPTSVETDSNQWLWIPPGFAHGNFFTEDSLIEYFCTNEYNPEGESGISPLSSDIDWSLCDTSLKVSFNKIVKEKILISDKDKGAGSVNEWLNSPLSKNFTY